MNLESHPYSQIFPLILDDEYQDLVNDIKENGLKEPIVLFQGQILDGRNRYHACEKVRINLDVDNPRHFRTFEGDDEAAKKFVWSSNYVRRYLTIDQKKELAATRLREHPDRSNRQIAEEVGLSDHTVAPVRQELEAKGEIPKTRRKHSRTKGSEATAQNAQSTKDNRGRTTATRTQPTRLSGNTSTIKGPPSRPKGIAIWTSRNIRRQW
jgi:ParB-like chromosome segregation protein Spo0J